MTVIMGNGLCFTGLLFRSGSWFIVLIVWIAGLLASTEIFGFELSGVFCEGGVV